MATVLDPVPACERMIEALEERAPTLSPQELANRLAGWRFFDCGGAVVMTRDDELHVAAPRERRGMWITRRDLREVLGGILQRFGSARTSVMADNAAGQAFVQRLGFRKTRETPAQVFYEFGGSAC